LIAVAVHDGHDLRDDVASLMALDEMTRTREEDPHTGDWVRSFPMHVAVHRSRFEVDLNRERENAVYVDPEDAWGLGVWKETPSEAMVEQSLDLYDAFYSEMEIALDRMVEVHGGFVLFDIHSFNHRRHGPDRPPEPDVDNPTVNLGTGSMPERWRPVADAFLDTMRNHKIDGQPIDARENVRFRGRQMAAFVHERYGSVACALAIEIKKIYMDEWTGRLHPDIHRDVGTVLGLAGDESTKAWSDVVGH
jgi:N-formylglutamate amidohydrolase